MTAATGEAPPPLAPLALTMGEPAGIGAEIALMAWRALAGGARGGAPGPAFFLFDDADRVAALAHTLGLATPVEPIARPREALAVFPRALPVLPLALPAPVRPGQPDPANAPAVVDAIKRAVALARDGAASAVVTNPIHKAALYRAGFRHPGHTEFLAELAGLEAAPVMMLACPGLRVVPVTVHMPLAAAIAALTRAGITHAGAVTAAALRRDFRIESPRLAVAALNPHAGEDGALGGEEAAVIGPAIDDLRAHGLDVTGPCPADTLFHGDARARYDAILCMYHDQALIPLKTIDFHHGVNITLGLPFVRTSPDHGTALGIAGQGTANPASLIAALSAAARMAETRAGFARGHVA